MSHAASATNIAIKRPPSNRIPRGFQRGGTNAPRERRRLFSQERAAGAPPSVSWADVSSGPGGIFIISAGSQHWADTGFHRRVTLNVNGLRLKYWTRKLRRAKACHSAPQAKDLGNPIVRDPSLCSG